MNLERRDFLKKSLAAGAAVTLGKMTLLGDVETNTDKSGKVDLVVVRGNNLPEMLDKGLEPFGGIKTFVKKGQKVLIKPNIGWDVKPELAANTNPDLVKRLIVLCQEAGAAEVSVFDHTCDNWQRAYSNSGMQKVCEDTKAKLVPGNDERMYRDVTSDKGQKLKRTKVHELYMDSDVIINIPVLKHHGGARMTCCMKNLMGVVWDRGFYHNNDLQRCIAEVLFIRKPTLNIVDAYNVMVRNGPRGKDANDLVKMDSLIVSPDIVAADAAALKILNGAWKLAGEAEFPQIQHVEIAADLGFGKNDLDKLNIERIRMS